MKKLICAAAVAAASVGCTPNLFIIPTTAIKIDEKAPPAEKPEVRYRPPVQASQVTAANAKEKAGELNEELDRDLTDLVETREPQTKKN